jgi:hypothetical protein
MKNCSFSIEFQQTAQEVVQLAGNAIKGAGGQFSGDDNEGQFKLSTGIGSVKGSYTITGGAINIDISDKPPFIGCGRIESEIRKYLNR